jgi:hypothetical protein
MNSYNKVTNPWNAICFASPTLFTINTFNVQASAEITISHSIAFIDTRIADYKTHVPQVCR